MTESSSGHAAPAWLEPSAKLDHHVHTVKLTGGFQIHAAYVVVGGWPVIGAIDPAQLRALAVTAARAADELEACIRDARHAADVQRVHELGEQWRG